MLKGYRTYLGVAGLIGYAVYQISQGNVDGAIKAFSEAVALFGLRQAVA